MQFLRLYRSAKTWLTRYRSSLPMTTTLLVLGISLTNTGLVLLLKQLGKTQLLEMVAYDRAVYARPDQPMDNRLLVVGVTEHYINQTRKINPSDEDMVKVLDQLSRYDPVVIGVDLYRNSPQEGRDVYRSDRNPDVDPAEFPHWQQLLQRLQQPNVVSILTFPSDDSVAIPPPPNIPPEQIGFNDLLLDLDRVVRRSLLMGWTQDPNTGENQSFHFSLAMTLALRYLDSMHGIQPQNNEQNPDYLQLGEAVFVPLTPDAGGYDRGDAEGYQFFLNYHSRNVNVPLNNPASDPVTGSSAELPGENVGIPAVAFYDVLQGNITREQVEGRIVLIGSTAPSLKDLFSTPYDNSRDQRFPGVFIHAQTVSQILDAALGDRPLMWFWPSWGENLWILGWTLVGGVVAIQCRPLWLLGLGTVVLVMAQGLSFYGAFLLGGWIPVMAPAMASWLTLGGVLAYRGQQALQQRNTMRLLLGQSISPAIADELWRSRHDILRSGKIPGQRLTATVLFSDIKGFSTLSEKQSPDELLEWLNEYLKEMIEAVTVHGGIVNKFTGDGMLAVFGVPMPRSDDEVAEDARQAVRCALDMRRALDALNQNWKDRQMTHVKEHIIQMRVGIFTGLVTAGSIGSKERLEYGVIGDSVNTASRLESCLKARQEDDCRILIANETMQYLISPELFESEQFRDISNQDGQEFFVPFSPEQGKMVRTEIHGPMGGEEGDRPHLEIESWGPRVLKGKDHKIHVYRLVGLVSEAKAQSITQSLLNCADSPNSASQLLDSGSENSTLITEL
ncbi:MAG: adenylate/guanylate cyclase domain-containing protein [Leptolyngbyaceae bacterium]|nr:adenylate/guanylate cyclase domain-containing protein [Leptolyngbyaceae bacterium]